LIGFRALLTGIPNVAVGAHALLADFVYRIGKIRVASLSMFVRSVVALAKDLDKKAPSL
jgi:hypothetical protein